MKKFMSVFIIILSGAILFSCAGDDSDDTPNGGGIRPKDPTPPEIQAISFAEIVDAEVLYITESKNAVTRTIGTRTSEEPETTLFKITFDGETEEVTFTDENGEPVEDVNVTAFRRMSDKYIYMSFDNITGYDSHIVGYEIVEGTSNDGESTASYQEPVYEYTPIYGHTQVIIQKSDGGVFKISPEDLGGWEWQDVITEDTEFQTDYNENVYFTYRLNNDVNIYKIYTHSKEVFITQISRDDMDVGDGGYWSQNVNWLVDRRGNVLLNNQYIRLVSGEFARYELQNPEAIPAVFYAWSDSEGYYYLQTDRNTGYTENKTYYNVYYGKPESPMTYWNEPTILSINKYNQNFDSFNAYVFNDKTILLQLSEDSYYESLKITIHNRDNIDIQELARYEYPNGIEFKYYGKDRYPCTEKYLYGMSESEIWRLSIETGEPEMLYQYDNEFVIKSMTVKNGIVTFTAFELRRGNDVVAEIYPDKTVKVIESTNGDKIIYLERIN